MTTVSDDTNYGGPLIEGEIRPDPYAPIIRWMAGRTAERDAIYARVLRQIEAEEIAKLAGRMAAGKAADGDDPAGVIADFAAELVAEILGRWPEVGG